MSYKKELTNLKEKINKIGKYLLILLLFCILQRAKMYNCSPFSVACLFALMWTGFNLHIIILEYSSVSLLYEFSLSNLYIVLTVVSFIVFCYAIHKRIKIPMNLPLVVSYATFSQITFLYYAVSNQTSYIEIIVYFTLLVISLIMYVLVFQVLILRGIYYKFTLNENIAFIYLLIVIGIGLSRDIWGFSIIKFVAVVTIIFLCSIKKNAEAVFVVLSLGVGNVINASSCQILGNLAILLLASGLFKYPHRYKMALSVILVDVCFLLYFNPTSINFLIEVLPVLCGVMLVLLLPNKYLINLQDKFYICESELSMRNIVNITRNNLHRKFNELSNVFNEMKAIHLNLIKEELTHEQVVSMLTNEIMKTLCKDCLDKQKCFRGLGSDEKSTIAKLIDTALTKGKVSLLDIPSNLATRCSIINLLIGRTNQIVQQYSQFLGMKKDVNNVKYLLAEQLGAVAQIMLDLGDNLDKHINFDTHKESQLMNELLAENIICSEVLIYNESNDNCFVNLIVKGDNAYNPIIEKIVSKKIKTNMRIGKVEPIDVNEFFSVHLIRDNNYDIVFGLSSCTKTGSVISGDTHSLIRLGDNRFLLALCDGMGSGERANRTSALTISLIENFYKAGFNNDMVVASVNKLLSINNEENFATLDLCLIDLNKELIDFVKIGAPYSFIKHESFIERVDGGALPIGVIENISPSIHKTSIDTKSIIVMATDGVTDSFKENEDFEQFIKGIASTNPQVIAQTILDEAARRDDNVIKDDMTVLVARTFRKNS